MIAESYGGKDEPVDTLVGSFVDISVQVTMDPLRIKEKPNEKTYQVCSSLFKTAVGNQILLTAIHGSREAQAWQTSSVLVIRCLMKAQRRSGLVRAKSNT